MLHLLLLLALHGDCLGGGSSCELVLLIPHILSLGWAIPTHLHSSLIINLNYRQVSLLQMLTLTMCLHVELLLGLLLQLV